MLYYVTFEPLTEGDFGRELLIANNKLRIKHGSAPLKWSPQAATRALEWANHLAESGTLQHGNHEGMGQNVAYKMGQEFTAEEVADMWYQEISYYDYNRPGFSSNTGHFTQMIWAGSTAMGAARVVRGNRFFVVANYMPPGNMIGEGQFERNVKTVK